MANNKKFDIEDIKINLKNTQKKHTEKTSGARTGSEMDKGYRIPKSSAAQKKHSKNTAGAGIGSEMVNGYRIPKLSAAQKQLLEKTSRKYGVIIPSYTKLRKMAVTPSAQKTLSKTLKLRQEMSTQSSLYPNLSQYDYNKRAVFRANLPVILAKLGLYNSNESMPLPTDVRQLLDINIFKYDYSKELNEVISGYSSLNRVKQISEKAYYNRMYNMQGKYFTHDIMLDSIKKSLEKATTYFADEDIYWNSKNKDVNSLEIDEFREYINSVNDLVEQSEIEIGKHEVRMARIELERRERKQKK